LASTIAPLRSTTICAPLPRSNAVSRSMSPASGAWPLDISLAMTRTRSRIVARTTFWKMRRLMSAGRKSSACVMSISDFPSSSTPSSSSAKWNRRRMRACVSALKYMSVLRHTSRSMREIGASCTRSLRPKITARRRSRRKM
jgi:hypothetical protein